MAEAIATIKNFISEQEQGSGHPSSHINFYLEAFCKIVGILFSKLQNANNFQSKFIANALKAMEIPMYIEELHKKLSQKKSKVAEESEMEEETSIKQLSRDLSLKTETMFNLLRIFLLGEM